MGGRQLRTSIIKRSGRQNFSLRWVDRQGRIREKSAGVSTRRAAERAARQWEAELRRADPGSPEQSWETFCLRYELEQLPLLRKSSRGMWRTTRAWVEKTISPDQLADLTQERLQAFIAALRRADLSPASVRAYWRTLRAALGWARDLGLIGDLPRVRLGGGEPPKARSRGVTEAEFQRILEVVPEVRPRDFIAWRRFLRGLYHSGLRCSELLALSWDPASDVSLFAPGAISQYPAIRFAPGGQKNGTEQWVPVGPECWAAATESGEPRQGYVFPLPGVRGGQLSEKRAIRTISAIGKASGVITNPATGRHATSHDIGRRAFLTRQAAAGMPLADLQKLARHASIDTTLRYYHAASVDALGSQLWR